MSSNVETPHGPVDTSQLVKHFDLGDDMDFSEFAELIDDPSQREAIFDQVLCVAARRINTSPGYSRQLTQNDLLEGWERYARFHGVW